jgi:glycosyltransferase involved in cell wall biosynthesis
VFVVHSECLGEHLAPRKSQRSVAIAHGVKIRDEPLPLPQQPVVGFFGRLASYKGLDVLAKAMPQVWSARPELQLLVSGWGNCKLGLDDYRVRVDRRYIPESEIGHFFKRTSLMVLPYTQASQSGVGSMAAGYGVPVIASNVGGLPDLTLDRSYVFSVGDDAELAAAILRHVDDGADVRRRVLEQVAAPRSWEAVGTRLLELYTTLLDDS